MKQNLLVARNETPAEFSMSLSDIRHETLHLLGLFHESRTAQMEGEPSAVELAGYANEVLDEIIEATRSVKLIPSIVVADTSTGWTDCHLMSALIQQVQVTIQSRSRYLSHLLPLLAELVGRFGNLRIDEIDGSHVFTPYYNSKAE